MADTIKISASARTDFGKGAARRARREKLIPVIVYGGNQDETRHLLLPSHETFLALKDSANALVELEADGDSILALTKDVQIHPVRREILHVDFVEVRRGEKVTVDVPVRTVGETEGNTIHVVELGTLSVTAPATSIPEVIEVDINGLDDGDMVRVADLKLPAKVETEIDPEMPVVVVSTPRLEEELEAAEEELAAELGVDVEDLADQKEETEEGAEGESAEGEGSEESSEEKSED